MPQLIVHCVPAPDGVAAAPCGSVDGVALIPVVGPPEPQPIDTSAANHLFAWSLSAVLICFVVGLTVGGIVRVIRAA
ncbi:hypothetical protein VF14_35415 [Nostoc linckia z18]|nr:hypothetical protein VF14_35415 [Nostoc linckia z18]